MLKRSITYTNPFTDQEVTEEHHFHISKADLVRMQLEEHGQTYQDKDGNKLEGMQAKLQRMMDSEDGKAIMAELEDIIRRAYGVRDGDRFIKNDQVWAEFRSTEAYSQLFFELCTKAEATSAFINGVVPKNLEQIAEEVQQEAEKLRHAEALGTKGDVPTAEATEPATGTTQPADDLPPEPDDADVAIGREVRIREATAENPVKLTEDEVKAMDSDEFRSGLATGRYKLS